MKSSKYVHGYSDREALRLNDQAATLDDIIHNDSIFPKESIVLEAGCALKRTCLSVKDKLFMLHKEVADV